MYRKRVGVCFTLVQVNELHAPLEREEEIVSCFVVEVEGTLVIVVSACVYTGWGGGG